MSKREYCAVFGRSDSRKRREAYSTRRLRLVAAREIATHTETEWHALLMLFPYCLGCGATDRPLTKDHIVPVCQGGSDGIDNLQPLCHSCNSSKSIEKDFRPVDWRKKLDALFAFARTL